MNGKKEDSEIDKYGCMFCDGIKDLAYEGNVGVSEGDGYSVCYHRKCIKCPRCG